MGQGNRQFDVVVEEGFREWCTLAPEVATFAGLSGHDSTLGSVSKEALDARIAAFSKWAARARALDRASLSPGQALDCAVLDANDAIFRFEHEEVRPWEMSPDALGDIGNLFFVMTFADAESETQKFENIASRLEALPKFVEETKARVTRPEPRWCRIAAEVAESFPSMLTGLVEGARIKAPALVSRMERAAKAAADSAASHRSWCAERGSGDERWALGADRFAELLRLKGIETPPAEIEALGLRYIESLEKERAALAEILAPGKGPAGALAVLKADHPRDFDEAIGLVRSLVADSRRLVHERGLCDLPEGEELVVTETPEFMRALTPFAAIFPAARFARVQRGLYIVTRPANEAGLADAHRADIRNVVVHEGYPGHHVQLATANRKTSLLRSVDLGAFPSWAGNDFAIDLIEGWAHYCEQMMKEHGWCDTPADRFVLANDALWRAVRIVVDIRLHAGRMGFDEAVAFLHEKTGMSLAGATAEVNRYTGAPTYQLCYLFGKHSLLALREEERRRKGPGFDERSFHRAILETGNVPVAWLSRVLFS